MCGITGIVTSDFLTRDERDALPAMRELLTHRGPDDAGRYFDAHAGLGHRRLAVIDPQGGRQPISNEDGTVWIVCNGEIYNHVALRDELTARGHHFATRCDTEAIVHLYEEHGDDCLNHLHGMFALAVWDTRRKRLLLARDRLGEKSLYYRTNDRRIVFGSELKAVLAAPGVPRDIDVTALADYLALGFIPSPKTIYQGIEKLEPGQCLAFERGRVTRRTWWKLEHRGFSTEPETTLRDRLWERLHAATAERLIADVPIATFLSSGVDSAAIALAAVAASKQLGLPRAATCTVGFPESAFDERGAAAQLARRIGTRHSEHEAAISAASLLPRLAWHFDEPFADPSALPLYVLSRAAKQEFTVALSGDGGDELLAGYRRYRFDVGEERVRRIAPSWLRRGLLGPVARIVPDRPWMPQPLRARRTLTNIAGDGATAHARSIARMDAEQIRSLIHSDLRRALGDYDPFDHVRRVYHECETDSHLVRCQTVDLRLGLADGILTKSDRASMAHGLEIRCPMLDHRFVEFAMSIPPAMRIREGRGKHLLHEALRERLGDAAPPPTKRGFAVPLDAWFRDAIRTTSNATRERRADAASTTLTAGLREPSDLLDADRIRTLSQEHESGQRRLGAVLWSAGMLKSWAQQLEHALGRTAYDKPAAASASPIVAASRRTARRITSEFAGAGV